MPVTIGVVCNFWNEINALPGWLECHTSWADHVSVYQSGPNGQESTDGSVELLEKWNIPIHRGKIDDGFGIVRTAAIRSSPCDWVLCLDCDERVYQTHRVMTCSGESTPHSEVDAILQTYDFRDLKTMIPNWENIGRLGAKLNVSFGEPFDQIKHLRLIIDAHPEIDAVRTIRRHWHDFTFRRPTQNWHTDPDWQMRLVRNKDSVHFDPNVKMHERLIGANNAYSADMTRGPFFDHFHFTFKKMEQEQRSHDVAIYDKIHAGEKPPTWEEFKGQK